MSLLQSRLLLPLRTSEAERGGREEVGEKKRRGRERGLSERGVGPRGREEDREGKKEEKKEKREKKRKRERENDLMVKPRGEEDRTWL